MRYLLLLLVPLALSACTTQAGATQQTAAEADESPRPNIILFLVDDMGWQDTSVQFGPERTFWNDHYRTPNMQRLADRGVKFTNAYAASPVCSPTRCAILTGQNPARTGITDWVGHGISENEQLRSPEWTEQGLQPGDGNITLPAVLREHGYLTAHVGKAHFGAAGTEGAEPMTLGFEINIGGSHVGHPHGQGRQGAYFAPFPENVHPGLEDYPAGTYITDALTQEALKVIDSAIEQEVPLFLHLAHYAVHTPLAGQGDPRFLDNYPDDLSPVERDYAAMVESMDASLGAVMDHLEERGIADNTIIIFFSDNGGLSNHSRATTDGNNSDAWEHNWHNAPAFSGKGSGYDGGLRVPMIVAWAGTKHPGDEIDPRTGEPNRWLDIPWREVCEEPVHAVDLFPTILTIAGVINPVPDDEVDGIELTHALMGLHIDDAVRPNGLFWHYPHQWHNGRHATREAGIRPFSAVRRGDWKLIYFYTPGGGGCELYNLADDPGEQVNLAEDAEHLETRQRMIGLLLDRLIGTDAALPIDKATGDPFDLLSHLIEEVGR
ncbi:MAG: sulfatase [Planctomycetota bacterium]